MPESDETAHAQIVAFDANYWWRKNEPLGALLNNLMFLFIVVPIALVIERLYVLSFVVFALMVPYGFFVRQLAVRAVRRYLAEHPEAVEQFQQDGIIS
jgi:hypothetical protein